MKKEVAQQVPVSQAEKTPVAVSVEKEAELKPQISTSLQEKRKVSGLSLKSIQKKKEIRAQQQDHEPEEEDIREKFTEIQMQATWNEYVKRIKDKGEKILASTLETGEPKLKGETILVELPNDTMRIQLERDVNPLLGFLKRKLKNTHITIQIDVNEVLEKKYAFTPIEKYNKLREKNPLLDKLRTTFDLDI